VSDTRCTKPHKNLYGISLYYGTLTMSAALVSAFYDVSDILYQNRKNQQCLLNQQRTTIVTGERRILGAQAGLRMAPSPDSGHSSPVLGMPRELAIRKLDRSMSEPVDLRKAPCMSMGLGPQQQQQLQQLQNLPPQVQPQPSSRYKTELCRPFEENGHCKYGDKCQFAHGGHELRSLSRHPKYKTELCRTFHTIGFCPYGPRCHFIHNEDLRRLSQISQQKVAQQQRDAHAVHQQSPMSPAPTPIYGLSHPTAIQRPKALSFNVTLPVIRDSMMVRDSLGSCADSPPASVTDSPTMSPTFGGYEDLDYMHMPSAFSPPPPQSAPPALHQHQQHFTFPGDEALFAPLMRPLNVQTDTQSAYTPSAFDTQSALVSALNALQLQRQHESAPPSPPESDSGDSGVSCGSPLDISRGLRLPIFSQLSSSPD